MIQAQAPRPDARPLRAWLASARPLLKPGVPLDFEHHRDLEALYSDPAPEVVIRKAAQRGASEYAISWMLWMVDEIGVNGLYIMPTDKHVSDFSSARIGPAFEAGVSAHLAGRIVAGHARGADMVTLKRLGDNFLYLRGAKVEPDGGAAQLKSVDAGALVLDEVDEMDARAIPIARERLGHAEPRYVRLVSTPTYAGAGIEALYQQSDMRQWHVRCAHCGEWQSPGLDSLILESDDLGRPARWNGGADPHLACRKCNQPLDRLGPGEWVAEHPDRETHGYFLSGLFSAYKSLAELIGSRELNTGLSSTDETTRQQTYNQKLGLPYLSSQALSLTDAVLDRCCRDYALGPQKGTCHMGIDVGRLLHIVIRGHDGAARHIGACQSFDEAARIARLHGVVTCVVDALPETREARKFQAAFPRGTVWLAYFDKQKTGMKNEKGIEWNSKDSEVDCDRTRTLDEMYARFILAAKGEAGATLPANARDIADYYAHLKAPQRVKRTDAQGNEVAVYVESGSDHYSFSELYAYVASRAPTGWVRGSG